MLSAQSLRLFPPAENLPQRAFVKQVTCLHDIASVNYQQTFNNQKVLHYD